MIDLADVNQILCDEDAPEDELKTCIRDLLRENDRIRMMYDTQATELDLLRTQVRELRLQRDELVAALQVIVNTNPIYGASHDIAKTALAKVGEKL